MLLSSMLFSIVAPSDIIGGTLVSSAKDYPFLAEIQIGLKHACAGTFLTSNAIVTAGHCSIGGKENRKVFAYRLDRSDTPVQEQSIEYSVEKIIVHPAYDWKSGREHTPVYDIAIWKLQLKTNPGNKTVVSAEYGESRYQNLVAVGWGSTVEGGPVSSKLNQVKLNFINESVCLKDYESFGDFGNFVFCAGDQDQGGLLQSNSQGKDTCGGDSGGPLLSQGKYLVGLTSWGRGCGKVKSPGVYTKVSFFRDWIDKVLVSL